MTVTVVHEPLRPHPLVWIHRSEARSIVQELRAAGRTVAVAPFRGNAHGLPKGPLLLRVSDPVMLRAARILTDAAIAYRGPGAAVIELCYDKHEAWRVATAAGVDCPATALASEADAIPGLRILKPRQGSDSIGVRLLNGPVPAHQRTPDHIVQEFVRGQELTIGLFRGRAGEAVRILLPEGTLYSFTRKYLLRPPRAPLADAALARRVRGLAENIARVFGVDWAGRVDLIHETASGRLRFLECEAAPLVSAGSVFAASFAAAGVGRDEQLRWLLDGG
jgi:D-alanine-D-alanine ligase-like ATP-grasp enzyme